MPFYQILDSEFARILRLQNLHGNCRDWFWLLKRGCFFGRSSYVQNVSTEFFGYGTTTQGIRLRILLSLRFFVSWV